MKMFFISLLLFAVAKFAVCQKKQPLNLFLNGQTSFMAYDQFRGFTGGGFGAGLQAIINLKQKIKPQVDITANLFSINKILFVFENGQKTGPKQTVAAILGGIIYVPADRIELAFSAGPAFHNDGNDFGIKPYAAYYLGKRKIIKAHASLTHIFVRNTMYNSNTGIISAGLAIKFF